MTGDGGRASTILSSYPIRTSRRRSHPGICPLRSRSNASSSGHKELSTVLKSARENDDYSPISYVGNHPFPLIAFPLAFGASFSNEIAASAETPGSVLEPVGGGGGGEGGKWNLPGPSFHLNAATISAQLPEARQHPDGEGQCAACSRWPHELQLSGPSKLPAPFDLWVCCMQSWF